MNTILNATGTVRKVLKVEEKRRCFKNKIFQLQAIDNSLLFIENILGVLIG